MPSDEVEQWLKDLGVALEMVRGEGHSLALIGFLDRTEKLIRRLAKGSFPPNEAPTDPQPRSPTPAMGTPMPSAPPGRKGSGAFSGPFGGVHANLERGRRAAGLDEGKETRELNLDDIFPKKEFEEPKKVPTAPGLGPGKDREKK